MKEKGGAKSPERNNQKVGFGTYAFSQKKDQGVGRKSGKHERLQQSLVVVTRKNQVRCDYRGYGSHPRPRTLKMGSRNKKNG